ncbi:MAG: ABC transporter permease [Bacteroidia bacterium]
MKSNISWYIKMAIRDSRKQRARLLLFISAIVLGLAAMVSINTFIENVKNDINAEAKGLLGADLVIRDNKRLDNEIDSLIDVYKLQKAEQLRFNSMVRVVKNEGTRLVNVVGTETSFPFYGQIETEPFNAYAKIGLGNKCVVDKTLAIQFDIETGDKIQLGELEFEVLGKVVNAPGQTGFSSAVAPSVYIPLGAVKGTGLIKFGSRISEYRYLKVEDKNTLALINESFELLAKNNSIRLQSYNERSQQTGEAFGDAGNFLNLVAFIALLLGCLGIASSVNIYLKSKFKDIAVLACIGIPAQKAFYIFIIQILVFGFLGSVAGVILGSAIAYYLPLVMSDFLPVEVNFAISYSAILFGMAVGLLVSIIFTLPTFFKLAQVSPLMALKSFIDDIKIKVWQTWLSRLIILTFIIGFSWYLLQSSKDAFIFTFSCGIAILLLAGISQMLKYLGRKLIRPGWSFVMRQSLSNLFRPNNQSTTLISTIGLGTALISTLFFTQDMLLNKVSFNSSNDDPNMILFDIQSPQLQDVGDFVKAQEMPLKATVPIVTMRLKMLRGKYKSFYFPEGNDDDFTDEEKEEQVRDYIFNREWRVSFRDTLNDNEKIIKGEWIGKYNGEGPIPISLEERNTGNMKAKVGDLLTFDVQGAPIECYVASVREVDFRRIETNFTILFPINVLEKAPQTHVIITRASSPMASALFQKNLISEFPTISIVDLNFIIETVTEIIDKLKFVITFMSLFSILTGLIVLVSSISNSRYQRIKETVLLKTVGASAKTVLQINLIEYAIIGFFAALAGIILAIAGSYALSIFLFDSVFIPTLSSLAIPLISIPVLVLAIGYFGVRSITKQPPLDILRKEN